MLVPQWHAESVFVGREAFPLTCLSPLCSAAAVLRAGDVLTSWWVLSVLLHSSFRFSSSLSLCLCSRRSVAGDGVPPRMFSMDGLRPKPSAGPPGKPVLPEPRGSRPGLSPLLYSAQRFRMVSSRCLSCGNTQRGTSDQGSLTSSLWHLNVATRYCQICEETKEKGKINIWPASCIPFFNKRANIGFIFQHWYINVSLHQITSSVGISHFLCVCWNGGAESLILKIHYIFYISNYLTQRRKSTTAISQMSYLTELNSTKPARLMRNKTNSLLL